jgi:hypothetical protein
MYVRWQGFPGLFTWGACFRSDADFYANPAPSAHDEAPSGSGDVPGMVADGAVNPVYAVVLWEATHNARPCGTQGYEQVALDDILQQASARSDGYARQGTDQTQFIPSELIDQSQLPPQWLSQVWNQPAPTATPADSATATAAAAP